MDPALGESGTEADGARDSEEAIAMVAVLGSVSSSLGMRQTENITARPSGCLGSCNGKCTRQVTEEQLMLAKELKRKLERLGVSSDNGAVDFAGDDEGVESLRNGV